MFTPELQAPRQHVTKDLMHEGGSSVPRPLKWWKGLPAKKNVNMKILPANIAEESKTTSKLNFTAENPW